MNTLLQIGLSNAVVAGVAAVVVMGLTRVWRNPHLAHLLWALVLLKLVTPPLVAVPMPIATPLPRMLEDRLPTTNDAERSDAAARVAAVDADAAESTGDRQSAEGQAAENDAAENRRAAADDVMHGDVVVHGGGAADVDWRALLVFVWAGGAAAWTGLLAARLLRFQRLVRDMPAAPEAWQEEIATLAARLDLCAWPSVRLAEGAISPLLWAMGGRAVIVMPRALAESLGPRGARALLAHELAHYYRRDHWMRWFEMLVLAICWWNPVAWWARRQLRVVEEQCCDACAVWLLDGEARSYAMALLTTIEFLSDTRSISPVGASGIGGRDNLKGRFKMILESRFGRRLSWRTRLAVAAVGLAILPLALSAARSKAQSGDAEAPARAGRPAGGWARLSPFTAAHVRGDAADVEFEGKQYELVSIDGLTTKELLDGARKQYGILWEKRFVEDLVEVMDGVGHKPAGTVKLVLRDPTSGETKTAERAPMSAENRAKLYAKLHHNELVALLGGRAWARLSPFTAVRVKEDEAEVEFDGQRYQLVSIDDLPTKEILDSARKQFGKLWEKRFVEDLVEVMDAMGHRPGDSVKLVLRDPRSSAVKTVERAPMTAENRQKVYIARYAITADDATRIRQLIDQYAAAVEKSDLDALAKMLRPHPTGEGRDVAYFGRATKELPAGSQINLVRTIVPLHNNHAMVVTDFFGAEVPGQAKPRCVVYHCVRQNGQWLIDSIEVVDDAGLGRALRDAPKRALAEAVD
ncbi:MAG TPA: M56 family metallopeptidase [Pirellulales bacterium]|jgi:beta-lactamase regulating signal transducer with metallopeptidase domain|nr:M56 family metallopeptidase [Pirellulales bacterium]